MPLTALEFARDHLEPRLRITSARIQSSP
jgi:hypothetical protein